MFDLIVLGAGPGGYEAALFAAELGKSVALVEERQLGGTCLNRGCIPTKAYLHAAACGSDRSAMLAHKDAAVLALRKGVEAQLNKAKVTLLQGRGTLVTQGIVEVDGERFEAEHVLLAVGSAPAIPAIAGAENACTSDDLLNGELPAIDRLTIIGGGVIGVEFATIFANLGTQVTILEYEPRILPQMDREIAQSVAMSLKKQGITLITAAAVSAIAADKTVTYTAKEQTAAVPADEVLLATGRRPNTAHLSIPDLNTERGFIPANDRFETCIPKVYAIGDCRLGAVQLAHNATAEGCNAVAQMFGTELPFDLSLIPACVYTSPEVAAVGASGGEGTYSGKALTASSGKGMAVAAERGYIRLVFETETDKLVGAQAVCDRATDMIGLLAVLIQGGVTRRTILRTVFPHPTFAECIRSAAVAAER